MIIVDYVNIDKPPASPTNGIFATVGPHPRGDFEKFLPGALVYYLDVWRVLDLPAGFPIFYGDNLRLN